jgi:hypothetical protein
MLSFSAFCSRSFSDWLRRSGLRLVQNLFAKEHNNVAEIYQKSSFSCAGRLSGDRILRPGGYYDVAGPFTSRMPRMAISTGMVPRRRLKTLTAGGINGENQLVQAMMPASLNRPLRC